MPPITPPIPIPWRGHAPAETGERNFRVGLACALLVHAALLVGTIRSTPRTIGAPDGNAETISVELVEAPALAPSAESSLAPQIKPSVAEPVTPPTLAAPPPEPTAQPANSPAEVAQPQKPLPLAEALDNPALFTLTEPSTAKNPKEPATNSHPQQRTANLDLSLPKEKSPASAAAALERSAYATRPPGITRSPQNDEFARGVIKALKITMPPPSGTLGRVTIRLFLSENGDLLEVRLIRSGNDSLLDQSVMFAAKQSSFPIPPNKSTPVDRTFLVTYVYD